MASADNQNTSSFPPPPMQYINKYTDDNVKFGRAPKPPPPIKDSYSMFGVEFRADDQIIRPLESQSLLRLHPHNYDHKRELKKLNYSILVNFLDLLDVLVKAPESRRRLEKIDDLTLLFIHMHHLINEFRPHQARETLKVMLENQKEQRIEITERFEKRTEQVKDLLNATIAALPDDSQLDTKLLINKSYPSLLSTTVTSQPQRDKNATGLINPSGSTPNPTTNNNNNSSILSDEIISLSSARSSFNDSDFDDDDDDVMNRIVHAKKYRKPKRKLKKKIKREYPNDSSNLNNSNNTDFSNTSSSSNMFYDDLGTMADDDDDGDDNADFAAADDDTGAKDETMDGGAKDDMMRKVVDGLN